MKAPKIFVLLALAGFCSATHSQARSHKFEIKHLERQRAERLEEHREAKERLNELSSATTFETSAADATRLSRFVSADIDDESTGVVSSPGPASIEHNWQVKNPDLIRQRELEESRMREAAREIAKLDTQIRKQKARERRIT
jgi:hypothetical protein